MSLFKILRGDSSRIGTDITQFHDGYAYFTPDNGGFYIDATVGDENQRIRVNPEGLPIGGGTMAGAIAMGNNKITGLANGAANNDAVNKGQMDSALSGKADESTVLSHTSDTTIHVTTAEKNTWNAKQDAIPANTYDAYGAAAAVQTNLNAVTAKISSSASSTNQLVSASEMGDAIEAVEAKQLYATASQGSFATKAALTSATTFYNADGTVATPTKNDVAYVLADESHSGKAAKYVIASVDPVVWGFVITFSDTTFNQTQMDAINSGATSAKISGYDGHVADSDIHVTAAQKTAWSGKQDAISDLAAIRSGAGAGATAVQPEVGKGLFSGNYNDLSNKPTIPTVPTNVSAFTNDAGYLTQHQSLSAYRTASAQDTIDNNQNTAINGKEAKGKITIGGVEKTANSHTVTIVTNGVTTNLTLVGVS